MIAAPLKIKKAMIDYSKKPKYDFIKTPKYAVLPLLKYLPKEKLTIWECADAGDSKITDTLKENGYNVINTDILTGFDFLKDTPDFNFDIIITNPPYSLKDEWLYKCYEYNKPFALLLPLTALEGITRGNMYRQNTISLIVLDRRVSFTGDSSWFAVGWFLWKMDIGNKLYFEELKKT